MTNAEDDLVWVARDQRAAWEASRPRVGVARRIRRRTPADLVRALELFSSDLVAVVRATNCRILERSLIERRDFLDSVESQPLTVEQATAVVTIDNRVQVVAAAGSGKTSVMVARAAYAVRYGVVRPDRLLLLAFNRDAADQLQRRVEQRLGEAGVESTGVRADTFHAFGLSVIGRATGRKPRLAGWLGAGGDVRMVSRIVDELRDAEIDFRFKWDLYRLLFAPAHDPAIDGANGEDEAPPAPVTTLDTMRGERVKSQGERLIADWLFLSGIDYEYEKPYSHEVADADHSQYRPDFFYPDIDVWHEHWAIGSDGRPPVAFVGYEDSMRWKKATHRRFGTDLIETTWADIVQRTGFGPLHDELAARGVRFDWRPERARGRAVMTHDDLAKLVRTFMTHVKANGLTRAEVADRCAQSRGGYRSRLFLDVYWPIHDAWHERLRRDGSIDFEDMLAQAAEAVEGGTDMGYDMVLVDEFQDASPVRARLARALVDRPGRFLMTVGDDWQAINRFAGADISVMTDFNDWFGEGPTLKLQTTFRCTQTVADVAATFVQRNPGQLRKKVRSSKADPGARISLIRVASESEIAEVIQRWLADLSERVERATVDVLGRYGFEKKVLGRPSYQNLDVNFRTVHSSKGLEADYVLVPRMVSGTFGFPCEVADDPVLGLVMSGADRFPHGEERRLFYVALTRAKREVTLVTVRGCESSFISELERDGAIRSSPFSTAERAVPCPACGRGSLVLRDGPYGQFVGCTGFPECRHTERLDAVHDSWQE